MPNWCQCQLTIRGKEAEVFRLIEKVKGPNGLIDFNVFVPMPKEYIVEPKDNSFEAQFEASAACPKRPDGMPLWYDWSINNWGTKWNAAHVQSWNEQPKQPNGDSSYTLHFDTAWSPPRPILNLLRELYPKLEIYFEFEDEFDGKTYTI